MKNEKIKILELIKILNEASDRYYNTSEPIMSDKAWDDLFDELKELEDITGIAFSNSPTKNVGYEVKSQLSKVEHSIPLKSLDKTKEISKVSEFIGDNEVLFMLKGDGLTCELIYEDGVLIQGSTRGNKYIGEVITHNVKTFKNVPLSIKFKGYLKITGEAVIFEQDLTEINKTLEKESNSRNLVAGSVRQLNSEICDKRNVKFLAFNLLECIENDKAIEFKKVSEQFNFLNDLGFNVINYSLMNCNNVETVESTITCLREFAIERGIPIDGVVLKYNDITYGLSLGETEHHPLNAIAFKFYNEEFETKYLKTEWQVSRTGVINPVAIFEEVDLDGALTTRATLHNIDYFNNLQLGKGDTITIARMNEVIPKVLNNKTRSNTEVIPSICPVCGEKTEIRKLKIAQFLVCTNENCSSKRVTSIQHYCSRDAMNIVGLSESTITKLIDNGFIKRLPDIYKLEDHKSKIIELEGFGTKSYNNLIQSINNSKRCNLNNFLYGLGITSVGKGTAKDLANHFKTIECFTTRLTTDLINNNNSLINIKDIGEITSNDIYSWWEEFSNKELVSELLKHITISKAKETNVASGMFSSMKIYCTGTFANYKKDELKKIVEKNGGTFANGYAKSLSLLVVGSVKGSTKADKAVEDGVKVITEEDFVAMINQ